MTFLDFLQNLCQDSFTVGFFIANLLILIGSAIGLARV
jgi:hypothetical protein